MRLALISSNWSAEQDWDSTEIADFWAGLERYLFDPLMEAVVNG